MIFLSKNLLLKLRGPVDCILISIFVTYIWSLAIVSYIWSLAEISKRENMLPLYNASVQRIEFDYPRAIWTARLLYREYFRDRIHNTINTRRRELI